MQTRFSDGTVMLCGAITRKEMRTTNTGKQVCNFGLSIGTNKDEKKYANCVAWNKLAKCIDSYSSADTVVVFGTMNKRSYTSRDGENKEVTECVVLAILNGMQFKGGEEYQPQDQYEPYVSEPEPTTAYAASNKNDDFQLIESSEDLPF